MVYDPLRRLREFKKPWRKSFVGWWWFGGGGELWQPLELSISGQRSRQDRGASRVIWLKILFVMAILVLVSRMFQLSVIEYDKWAARAQSNSERRQPIMPIRGEILDRYGQVLATNTGRFALVIDNRAQSPDNQQELAQWLSLELSTEVETYQKILQEDEGQDRVLLERGLDLEQAITIESQLWRWPGLQVEMQPQRQYPGGPAFSHLIGYLAEADQREVDSGQYILGQLVGRAGLESYYEDILRGRRGQAQLLVDAKGQAVARQGDRYPAEPGQSLHLSIDGGWQQYSYERLETAISQTGAKAGLAIAMEVDTGEILMMASLPSYDNNLFVNSVDSKDLTEVLTNESDQALFDRSIAGQYPPGSILKVVVAAAALQEEIVKNDTLIYAPGFLREGGEIFPDWIYRNRGYGFGWIALPEALAKSSDVYFYQVGAGYNNQPGLGSDLIADYGRRFSLGERTGIDLPGEESGIIWSKTSWEQRGQSWYWGNTAHMAIGQGYTLVTPLQMVVMTAAIANGGTIYRPHLLSQVGDASSATLLPVEALSQVRVDESHLAEVRQAMLLSVNSQGATGYALRGLSIEVAGKTGTAQHDKTLPDHAWFISFAPFDRPEIAMVVLIEEGGEGSSVAAPVARDLWTWWIDNRY